MMLSQKSWSRRIIMYRCLKAFLLCLCVVIAPITNADDKIATEFDKKLNKINVFLEENHKKALQEPNLLIGFVNQELLEVWSARNTIRAMLGTSRWKQLTDSEANVLIKTYENTIRRYLFEVLQQYQGQKASVESVRLNDKGNKGWLRVRLESPSFPTLNVDLKIYKEQEQWTVYDFSFQGISFVKMKRGFFRDTFDTSGAVGVVAELREKNKEFNQAMAVASDE
jgi:phospholipid transport system substrate-binding protein